MKNIVLTGFMMAGKTHIGKALAEMLGYGFADTDKMIVSTEDRSINDIFAEDGEEYFRNVEAKIIKCAASLENTVISTGGGAVLRSENPAALRKTGIIVNLKITPEVIAARLEKEKEGRPLIKTAELSEVIKKLESREKYYADCDFSITVSDEKTPAEHAEEIIKKIRRNGEI